MTKYTFSLKNNNNTTTFFTPNNKSTDYSKMLDDLIFSDIINKNEWLKTTKKNNNSTIILKDIDLYGDSLDKKVCSYFANYKLGNNCPFIKDKIYYLADGTPFYITDDYITIGFDTYYFYEFGKPMFFSNLSESMKKTICEIYVDGLKITIKK